MPDAFAPAPSPPSTAPLFTGDALLDAEKLDAYRVALEFQALACQLLPSVRRAKRSVARRIRLEAERSVSSSRAFGARSGAFPLPSRAGFTPARDA